jgi:hypothetical protein
MQALPRPFVHLYKYIEIPHGVFLDSGHGIMREWLNNMEHTLCFGLLALARGAPAGK